MSPAPSELAEPGELDAPAGDLSIRRVRERLGQPSRKKYSCRVAGFPASSAFAKNAKGCHVLKCSHVSGRRNLWQTMGAYLLLFGFLILTITYFEAHLLRPFVLLGVAGIISFLYLSLYALGTAGPVEARPVLFDESDEPLIRTLRLNRE